MFVLCFGFGFIYLFLFFGEKQEGKGGVGVVSRRFFFVTFSPRMKSLSPLIFLFLFYLLNFPPIIFDSIIIIIIISYTKGG